MRLLPSPLFQPASSLAQPLFALTLVLMLVMTSSVPATVWAASTAETGRMLDVAPTQSAQGPAPINLVKTMMIAPETARVSLRMRDTPVVDMLNLLARQGGFNVVLDPAINGSLTVDIDNVSINKALDYILSMGNLQYSRDGKTLLIYAAEGSSVALSKKTLKAIPVRYRDGQTLMQQLNIMLATAAQREKAPASIATYDQTSNSLLMLGNEQDIALAQELIQQLDYQPHRKIYKIKHSTPAHVAQVMVAQFSSGTQLNTMMPNGGGQAGGAAGAIQAGGVAGGVQAGGVVGGAQAGGAAGGAQAGGVAGGGQAGGTAGGAQAGGAAGGAQAGGAAGGAQAGGAAGGMVQAMFASGMTFIPEPVSGTLTVLGTPEQLAMVDALIDKVDVRRPQVSIEVSLVELSRNITKVQQNSIDNIGFGEFRLGFLNGGTNFLSTGNAGMSFTMPTIRLLNQLKESQGKILANPTVVALDGTTSQISITDQVATFSFTVTAGVNGVSTIVPTPSVQDVGITMSITPQVSNDGSVTLTANPQVTQLIDIVQGGDASTGIQQVPLIATRSLTIAGVRIRDGETLILGGLLQERRIDSWDKVPGLANLPILGAMFRATGAGGNTNGKTELLVMVTPHILKDEAVTYFDNGQPPQEPPYNPNEGKVQPPALPRFAQPSGVSSNFSGRKGPVVTQPVLTGGSKTTALQSQADRQPLPLIEPAEPSPAIKVKRSWFERRQARAKSASPVSEPLAQQDDLLK